MIEARANTPLLALRHGERLDPPGLAQPIGLSRQPFALGGIGGAGEAAAELEIASDASCLRKRASFSQAALASAASALARAWPNLRTSCRWLGRRLPPLATTPLRVEAPAPRR
jgi:hypothetical protein